MILYGYRQKRRTTLQLEEKNRIILSQSHEVKKQKDLLEEKQKEVLDSIHYAKRIQQALLPSQRYLERVFKKFNSK